MMKTRKMKTGKRMNKISLLKIDKDCLVDRSWIRDYVHVILTVCRLNHIKVNSVEICRSTNTSSVFGQGVRTSCL